MARWFQITIPAYILLEFSKEDSLELSLFLTNVSINVKPTWLGLFPLNSNKDANGYVYVVSDGKKLCSLTKGTIIEIIEQHIFSKKKKAFLANQNSHKTGNFLFMTPPFLLQIVIRFLHLIFPWGISCCSSPPTMD